MYEYTLLKQQFQHNDTIAVSPVRFSDAQIPTAYHVEYRIRSMAGIYEDLTPFYADRFLLLVDIPPQFPCIDAPPALRFLTADPVTGDPIPHPWHPNIRYYGPLAGRVCINRTDSYDSIAWAVARIAQYLRYERYHALPIAPFPEDPAVAHWILHTAEPLGLLC